MYLPVFGPWSHAFAVVSLIGCIAALLALDLRFQRATAHEREGLAQGWTAGLRPLAFWVTALAIGVGVVFLFLFLLLSPVVALLTALAY